MGCNCEGEKHAFHSYQIILSQKDILMLTPEQQNFYWGVYFKNVELCRNINSKCFDIDN